MKMPVEPVLALFFSPPAIAIHDDCNMIWQLPQVNLFFERQGPAF
jgi:hypothetical protein